MNDTFPILRNHIKGSCLNQIPWELIASHDKQAQRNHCGQTLLRLKERGGLSPSEAIAVLEDRRWEPIQDEDSVANLKLLVEEWEAKQPCSKCIEKNKEINELKVIITKLTSKLETSKKALLKAENALSKVADIDDQTRSGWAFKDVVEALKEINDE